MQRRWHGAFDLRALGDAASAQVVDLHFAAASASTGAADDQVALGQRINFAIGAAQRRGNQGAALERLGVAHRRDADVNELPRLRKSRQLRGDDDGGDVFEL